MGASKPAGVSTTPKRWVRLSTSCSDESSVGSEAIRSLAQQSSAQVAASGLLGCGGSVFDDLFDDEDLEAPTGHIGPAASGLSQCGDSVIDDVPDDVDLDALTGHIGEQEKGEEEEPLEHDEAEDGSEPGGGSSCEGEGQETGKKDEHSKAEEGSEKRRGSGLLFEESWPPPSEVRAEIIRGGRLVSFMSEMCLSFFQQHELETWLQHAPSFPKKVLFGSICTGSGMDGNVMWSLMDNLRSRGIQTEFENVMMSEMVPFKQLWLLKQEAARHKRCPQFVSSPCLFVDAKDVALGKAPCCAHDPRPKAQIKAKYLFCHVRSADVFSCGSSCKYFSHANKNRSAGDPRTFLARLLEASYQDVHQSLTTLIAFRDYLRNHSPKIVLWENTDAFLDTPGGSEDKSLASNLDMVLQMLIALGYEAQPIKICSRKYGTPEIRTRLFILALLVESPWWRIRSSDEFDAVFQKVLSRLTSMQIEPPPLQGCMLPPDDVHVVAEFEACEKRKKVRRPEPAGVKWKIDLISFCQKHPELRWGAIEAAESSKASLNTCVIHAQHP